MATVLPFKGIRYNPNKVLNIADVVAPPYDVIPDQEQQLLHDRHPNNIIRLILGRISATDTDTDNRYTRAARDFNRWLGEGILAKDPSPSLYLTTMDFSVGNKSVTRYGLIALVKLESFDTGIILPHERTFTRVKSERLELMKTCHANFSQIFALYPDQNQILNVLKSSIDSAQPEIDLEDSYHHHHRLWAITDPAVHRYISEAMSGKNLFIADGHHRYETALAYRNWLKETHPDFTELHPSNYVMMYLTSMEDPGLVILPAHRMIKQLPNSDLTNFIRNASDYFDITSIPAGETASENARRKLISLLKSNSSTTTLAACLKRHPAFYLMSLKSDVMQELFADELSPSLMSLDVTVLTRLVLMKILGFDQKKLDDEKLFSYSSSEDTAIDSVISEQNDITFILNPTRIDQVRRIAEEGLTMPRKSTYFYPKVLTGLVINTLKADV